MRPPLFLFFSLLLVASAILVSAQEFESDSGVDIEENQIYPYSVFYMNGTGPISDGECRFTLLTPNNTIVISSATMTNLGGGWYNYSFNHTTTGMFRSSYFCNNTDGSAGTALRKTVHTEGYFTKFLGLLSKLTTVETTTNDIWDRVSNAINSTYHAALNFRTSIAKDVWCYPDCDTYDPDARYTNGVVG
jgi:hypothetical protein